MTRILLQCFTRTHWKHPGQTVACLTASIRCRNYHSAKGVKAQDGAEVHIVDLRSDTMTKPTIAMRKAMAEAEVGDDVFGEDPTINALQKRVAKLFNMESGLYVPTGTMGNLISVLAHCQTRGLEVLLGDKSHIHLYEQGGIATLGGVHPRTVANLPDGTFDLDIIDDYIRPTDDPHQPWTQLVCVENTHNFCGGKAIPISFMKRLREKADEYGIGVHMDGARMLNAAVALGVEPAEIVQYADSVSLCLSKGVGAPVGSVICGKAEFIATAHRLRKAVGGGMRQAGVIAAAAMVALDDVTTRLARDHEHAQMIAKVLQEHGAGVVDIDPAGVHSNIVMVDIIKDGLLAPDFCHRLNQVTPDELDELKLPIQVWCMPFSNTKVRLVTHSNMTREDIDLAVKKLRYTLGEMHVKITKSSKEPAYYTN